MYLIMKDSYKPEWICLIDGSEAWTTRRDEATVFSTLDEAYQHFRNDTILIDARQGFAS